MDEVAEARAEVEALLKAGRTSGAARLSGPQHA
jgi:hypothetical protein